MSLLSESYWKKVQNKGVTCLKPWSGPQLVGAEGSSLAVLGCAAVEIAVGTEAFQQEVVVVKQLSVDGILGMDFLTENRCTIN